MQPYIGRSPINSFLLNLYETQSNNGNQINTNNVNIKAVVAKPNTTNNMPIHLCMSSKVIFILGLQAFPSNE